MRKGAGFRARACGGQGSWPPRRVGRYAGGNDTVTACGPACSRIARFGNTRGGSRPLGYRDGMRLPVPGPRDLLHVLERGAGSIEQMLATVPRLVALLGRAEGMLHRVDALLDDVEQLVARIDRTRTSTDELVRRTGRVVFAADEIVARSSVLVDRLGPLVDRLSPLLDGMEPSLTKLQPTLERLAETTDPAEVDALVTLVDHLPVLALKMETDIVPVLDSLSTVAPDLHDLLDVSRELNVMLANVPGLGRVKKRIDQQQAAEGRG